MKAPLVATLICLCGAASAATCDAASRAAQTPATPPEGRLVLAGLSLPTRAAQAPDAPRQQQRALMAAIALRRTGGAR